MLPPVLPMVVYRGEQKWIAASDVKDLIEPPPPGLARHLPSMRYLLLEEVKMDTAELERMANLVAEVFRIESSSELRACIPPFVSFLRWTERAGDEQDVLKRSFMTWFTRAQKPAKLMGDDCIVGDISPEEMEPMLSERIEKWTRELKNEGRLEGMAEGRLEGKSEGKTEGLRIAAENLLRKGMSISEISEVTGLTETEVLEIKDRRSEV